MDHERQDLQIRQYRRKYHPNYNHFQITTQTHLIFIYYIKAGSDNLDTQTAVNLEILKQFGANGLEMAFPTQTIYNIGEK